MPPPPIAGAADGDGSADASIFAGVRFALYGFDAVSGSQYRVEMLRCGGADAGEWDAPGCTHVIVSSDRVYGDTACVAARADGKKVVTVLWVDDSLDLGELADADRVIYAPVRDLNGISGSKSIHICLTGYQKKWRQDIMQMANLIGANFSTKLAAHRVTHLLCYKFEGEKYELAKLVKANIVNHRWLEDCLKAWEILPVDDYKKSGWELEIMEAEAKDSEEETEDTGRGSSSSRHIGRSTPITEINTRAHVDPDVDASIHGPNISASNTEGATGGQLGTPKQISKAENVSTTSFELRAVLGSAPNTNGVTDSVDCDAGESTHPHIYPSSNVEAPADLLSRAEAKDDPDTRLSTLSSGDNCSKRILHSSETSRKVDQKHDGHVPDRRPTTVRQSFPEEKINLCESNLRSESNSASRNKQILGYHRRRSSKSVSPEANLRPVQQTVSPQCSEGNSSKVVLSGAPRKDERDFNELADNQILRENEVVKHVDSSCRALAHRRKSILSSDSSKPPNAAPGLGNGIAASPFPSKESASETAVSSLGRSSAEPTKVDGDLISSPAVNSTEKQMSGSFKSNLLKYRRMSLKLVNSDEAEKLAEKSADDNNMARVGKVKAPALHKTMTEKGCAICPSVDSEVRKEHPSVSLENGDTEMSDAQQVHETEVTAPNSEPDKVISHQNLEAVTSVIDECGIFPQKAPTSRVKNASTKRSRNTSSKRSRDADSKAAAKSVSSEREVVASKPMHDKAVSRENLETHQGGISSSSNAAECAPLFPEEILNSKSRKEGVSSPLGPNSKINAKQAVSRAAFANAQKNMKDSHRKLLNSASANENQGKSSQKVQNSIATNSITNGSRTADSTIAVSPTADKTETSFNEVVPPENGEAFPKRLSSSASADDPETCATPEAPNSKVRKVVAKRRLSAIQKHKSGIEPCKTASVFVPEGTVLTDSDVRISRNVSKVTVDQDPQKTNEDEVSAAVGSFCKDTMEDRLKDTQCSKSRSNKKTKTTDLMDGLADRDKENIPISSNCISKPKYRNDVRSKSITKDVQNGKVVLDERSMIERNDYGIINMLEPTWFILSGHRLLRKEYKSVLRRLKGRVCRDSHHWSYQATHLVTTELRRTEKFFAAAAAGRWILKPDYLTACNEAGKFLEEEPFEWHGHGLNNGDTISLDAPRKWRQLRQRTGHGAFYGMQIIIYGECIAPTLDTLKRTVRSGDGTILATSPPYTRLLKSNVDFAIVSAGMTSTDAWVQEFMRHNIPCISADYLVEYVCKPGQPLTKHVLFNMHDLAEKSFQKLLKNQQGEGGDGDVLSCSACGSSNREGRPLICGSDGTQAGCGVEYGAPGGEWMCHKCDQEKPAKKAKKSAKSSVLKCR